MVNTQTNTRSSLRTVANSAHFSPALCGAQKIALESAPGSHQETKIDCASANWRQHFAIEEEGKLLDSLEKAFAQLVFYYHFLSVFIVMVLIRFLLSNQRAGTFFLLYTSTFFTSRIKGLFYQHRALTKNQLENTK